MIDDQKWESATSQYLAELMTTTIALFKPEKTKSYYLREDSASYQLLTYMCQLQIQNNGEYLRAEKVVPVLKSFANEARERYVNSNVRIKDVTLKIGRNHEILNAFPKKYLAQISTWMKALPTPRRAEMDVDKWKLTFAPGPEELERQLATAEGALRDIRQLHRVSSKIAYPSNLSWAKRSGCLERTIKAGGALSEVTSYIPEEISSWFNTAGPLEKVRTLPKLMALMRDAILLMLKGDYDHRCGPRCTQLDKHPAILHLLVSSRGWKNRHLTMNIANLQYLASSLQKRMTKWLRNMPCTAEGLEARPDWITPMSNLVKKQLKFAAKQGYHPELYFMSGDLEGCTNRYIPEVSQALTLKGLSYYHAPSEQDEFVVKTSLGRYKIFFNNDQFELHRNHPETPDAITFVENLRTADADVVQTIGQHMSSSLSFTVMGGMHQAIFDSVTPEINLSHILTKTERKRDMERNQLARRLVAGAGHALYIGGLQNNGSIMPTFYGELKNLTRDHIGAIRFRHLAHVLKPLSKTLKTDAFAHITARVEIVLEKDLAKKGFMGRREVENDNVEYKGSTATTQSDDRQIFDLTLPAFLGYCNSSSPFKKGVPNADYAGKFVSKITLLVHLSARMRERPDTLYCSNTTVLSCNFDATGIFDGEYTLESMHYTRKVTIEDEQIAESETIRPVTRSLYGEGTGDDHLLFTNQKEILIKYMRTAENNWNQVYNKKANFISTEGFVVGERLGRLDGRNKRVTAEPYIKTKQLLVESSFGAASSWMERASSIRIQMLSEFKGRSGIDSLHLYRMIENAEMLLYMLNKKAIDYMIENSIDPRLPPQLGGCGVWKGIKTPMNDLTQAYLCLLEYYHTQAPEYFPRFVKRIKKIALRFRKPQKQTAPKIWEDGHIPVPRKEIKEISHNLFGFLTALSTDTRTSEVGYMQVASELRAFISVHYAHHEPLLYSVSRLTLSKPAWKRWFKDVVLAPTTLVPGRYSDETISQILGYIDDDQRTVGLSSQSYTQFLYLKAVQKRISKKISENRSMGIVSDPTSLENLLTFEAGAADYKLRKLLEDLEVIIALRRPL